LVPWLLLLLSVVPAVAGAARLATVAAGQASAADDRFLAAPLPVTLHILAVVPFSMLGAFQFAPGLRKYRWHRLAGRLLAPLGLIGALTGLWMAHFYPWPTGDGTALYIMRLLVGVAMAASIVRGVAALRRRDYATHGAWMVRGYALGMGAGTQVLTHLPWFAFVGTPGETSRAFLMASGWMINCAIAEWAIRRSGGSRPAVASA